MNILKIVPTAIALILSTSTHAALVQRLGGLAVYDDVTDLTWLADANAAGTKMTWGEAGTWAGGLTVAGIRGWRMPDTLQPDPTCAIQNSYGYNCAGSEMGDLFHNVLGGSTYKSITTTHNANYALFNNVQSDYYWTSRKYGGSSAWFFNTNDGAQSSYPQTYKFYAWAVHTGDVSPVPIPAALWLFGSGLIGLTGLARRKSSS